MSYTVSFDAASLIKGLHLQLETAITQAVQTTALTAQAAWKQTVLQTPGLWQPIKERYADSIRVEYDASGMGARIYSDDPMATPIENGIPARDMKRILDTSLKTRVAKNGKHAGQRYLIIPFRHNTPGNTALAGSMPQAVYSQAKELTKSSVTRLSFRKNQLGVMGFTGAQAGSKLLVRSREYKWGDRLSGVDIPKRFKGMYRFNTSSGGQNSSAYLTFRVMGEWSSGWVIKAQPGRFIVNAISEQAREMLKTEVTAAIASVS
jgi:hypothetical protein